MKKALVMAGVLLATLTFAAPGSAAEGETTYYVGAGDTKESEVSFKIRDSRIRQALIGAGLVTCGGEKVSLWKGFVGIPVEGNSFHRKSPVRRNDVFVFGGHIHGGSASGRMRITTGKHCDSGPVRWDADRVSKDEYEHFGHH
jgi:hypothetical protein